LVICLVSSALGAAEPRLQYVTTAHQLGPVNYRDPLGAMSPSGEWLAYSIAQHLYLQPIAGGPVKELPAAGGIIRHIAWMSDSKRLVIDDPEKGPRWWVYDIDRGVRAALWEAHPPEQVKRESLEQLAWSRDGKQVAGVVRKPSGGSQLWTLAADGSHAAAMENAAVLSFPAWLPDGRIGCLARENNKQTLSIPCGAKGTQDAYGALDFSPDGRTVYFGAPNAGTLDLWSRPVAGGTAVRLTQFTRDTYAPSAAMDGTVLFKLQDYRAFIAMAPAEGGATMPVTAFQSETPSFSPDGKAIGITYGSWRRIVDDFQYPDIAQDAGIVSLAGHLPLKEPTQIVQASKSEDQGLTWSPNGKWIAFHSHKDLSDDVWLQPADGSRPAKLITHFGRGAETGWPRWSADGKTVLVDTRKKGSDPVRGTVFTIEVDQNTGIAQPEKEIALDGFTEDVTHTEWGPGGQNIIFQAVHFPGVQGFYRVPRAGGKVTKIFGFTSEQRVPGFGASADGKWIAYIAPAADGFLQLFRLSMDGGSTKQLTFDRSNKTQPAYSPDGKQIAFTVWTYEAHFWLLRP
jgi:Tol biopolymer transport system component